MIWMIWHKHRKHSTADKKGSFSLYLHAIGIKNLCVFYKNFFLESKWLFFKSNNYKKKRRYFMDALITEAKNGR